jgi:hypothetical protein
LTQGYSTYSLLIIFQQNFRGGKTVKAILIAAWLALATPLLIGQSAPAPGHLGIVSDWTHRNVIYPDSRDPAVQTRIEQDPRWIQNQFLRHPERWWPRRPGHIVGAMVPDSQRDWSVSLGTGGSTGGQTFPSKYVFNVTAAPSCTGDYVATGIAAAGSTTQANLIAFNNLYVGTLNGSNGLCGTATTPSVLFAYNVRTGFVVRASVVLSLDGTKIAFVDYGSNSQFHVLTWTKGAGTSATAPATPTTMSSFTLGTATTNTIFVDYLHDAAYATAGTVMYKFSPVFEGTPAEVTTGGWPLTFSGAGTLSTPVYDQTTRHIFVEDTNGKVWYADDSGATAVVGTNTWQFATTDVARPPVVDSTNQVIYMYSPNGSSGSIIGQANTTLTTASQVSAVIGSKGADYTPLGIDFSNEYYSGTLTGAYVYGIGTDTSTDYPALYNVGFTTGFKMNSTTANGPLDLATAKNVDASAVTEFYNATLAKDFLFFGVFNNCEASGVTGGCVRALDITSGFPTSANPKSGTSNAILAASGGTSGITVDNNSSSTEASSIYFITLGTATDSTTCASGDYCLIKATQSGLD